MYIIGGAYYGFYRYDLTASTWLTVGPVPSSLRYGISYSLNGHIFHGLNYDVSSGTLDNKFWVYNSEQKTWISKNNFPGYSKQFAVAYFTANNKGYVLFSDKVFCEYDPENDTWTQLASFPGPGTNRYGVVSFVLDNKAYIGSGRDYYYLNMKQYDDFWIYDTQTNIWSESTHMPWGTRFNGISFVIGNKAYAGFGYRSSTPQRDLFEFDPDYPE
jgi:N-acetylneuraminic acid mutarotase